VSEGERRCPRCLARNPARTAAEARERAVDAAESGVLGTLLLVFGLLLATNVVLTWTAPDLPDEGPPSAEQVREQATLLTVVMALDTLLVLGAYASLRARVPPPVAVPGSAPRAWAAAPVLLGAALALNFGYHALLLDLAGIEPEADQLLASGHHTCWLLLLLCVAPAVVEELFFRRLALDVFRRSTGSGTAVFASSAMFAAAHTGALVSIPVLFVLGVVLSWARLRTASLALPMLLHFAHNLVVSLWDLHGA
jgi:membrane protease YdiL (CAAX protease family)